MPQVKIPGGPSAIWGTRRNSRVRLTHRLKINHDSIPFDLDLPRSCFGDFDAGLKVMRAVSLVLFEKVPKLRLRQNAGLIKITTKTKGKAPLKATITFNRQDLPALRNALDTWQELFSGAEWSNTTPAEELAPGLLGCFAGVDNLIASPPRHGGMLRRRINNYLKPAIRAAHMLVARQQNERPLAHRIKYIISKDIDLLAYAKVVREQGWNFEYGQIVALVDRSFRGAWDLANHPGLIYSASHEVASYLEAGLHPPPYIRFKDPQKVIHKYLYRDTKFWESKKELLSKRRYLFDWYIEWAIETFLGEPGEAARYYRLLP